MKRSFLAPILIALAVMLTASSAMGKAQKKRKRLATQTRTAASIPAANSGAAAVDGQAEAQLIQIYRLIGQARSREALAQAELLVHQYPNFQLAQLVYGDLLSAQSRPLRILGDVPDTTAQAGAAMLGDLREESAMRLKALRERPAAGSIPAPFIALSARNKHAIAVDASRSRLYLFENSAQGLKLLADYYVSVGKSGTDKAAEGDLRTPLGVYFVTSNLDQKSLKNFYGAGALPINYPNPYDMRKGRSGGGIWLHGTPPAQFSRAPKATDGCVVLANPDLIRIIKSVEIRTTPVVIAQQLQWVAPSAVQSERMGFEKTLQAWRAAKSSGDAQALLPYYTQDFNSYGKSLAEWTPTLRTELAKQQGRAIQLKDLSLLQWRDGADTMVVTFGEVIEGAQSGPTRRQYWTRIGAQWKIFFEGIIG